ncbi:MAG: RDD family protein [Rhodobacteraceae bacterium]|nr:RDD family protein [Paracoccaceae bacterium]
MLIDVFVLSQLTFYLVAPFVNGERVRLSGGIYQTASCKTVSLTDMSRLYFKEQGINAQSGSLCNSYQNGLFAGSYLLVSSETNEEGGIAEGAHTISTPLDSNGMDVVPVYPVSLLNPLVILLGMILLTWVWKGQTIGKKITRIRVMSSEGGRLTLFKVARREVLKFAPSIALFLFGVFLPQYALEQVVPNLQAGANIALVLGLLGGVTFAYILWWVAPLLWWNGRMPYDRINGSTVERYYN